MIRLLLECDTQLSNIEYVEDVCLQTLEHFNFTNIKDILFVVREGLINAFEASKELNGEEKPSSISFKLDVKKHEIKIEISNEFKGETVDVCRRIRNYDPEVSVLEDCGRGLFFISHLVDDLWEKIDSDGRFVLGMSIKEE